MTQYVYGVAALVQTANDEGVLPDTLEVWTDRSKAEARIEVYSRAYPEHKYQLLVFTLDTPYPGSPGSEAP